MARPDPPPSDEQIEAWRAALGGSDKYARLTAIEAAGQAGRAARSLVADLAALLTSEDYVPCTAREYEFSGHALLAQAAASAIESIGVSPEIETLRSLLGDPRIFLMPEASYDQGAYIGDYSSETIAPAAFAGRLTEMLGLRGFALLDDLAATARHEDKLIAWPSQRCIMRLADRAHHASPEESAKLATLTTELEAMPEVAAPNTHREFALRDLARHLRKRLAAL
ncbi:MAG: hypothetical protein AB7P20_05750 [Rhizobiaceae bacterium]